jgi:hypothetical protein
MGQCIVNPDAWPARPTHTSVTSLSDLSDTVMDHARVAPDENCGVPRRDRATVDAARMLMSATP